MKKHPNNKGRTVSTYHDKKYTHMTAFNHTSQQEVKMMKEAKKRGLNKSELIRELIDTL
tara:strand:- start:899 stop:1075 length:177 start_codon:yes stop_codon:yes gene_type:complete